MPKNVPLWFRSLVCDIIESKIALPFVVVVVSAVAELRKWYTTNIFAGVFFSCCCSTSSENAYGLMMMPNGTIHYVRTVCVSMYCTSTHTRTEFMQCIDCFDSLLCSYKSNGIFELFVVCPCHMVAQTKTKTWRACRSLGIESQVLRFLFVHQTIDIVCSAGSNSRSSSNS